MWLEGGRLEVATKQAVEGHLCQFDVI